MPGTEMSTSGAQCSLQSYFPALTPCGSDRLLIQLPCCLDLPPKPYSPARAHLCPVWGHAPEAPMLRVQKQKKYQN